MPSVKTWEATMQSYYAFPYTLQAIAVAVVLLVSFAVNMFVLSPPTAEADNMTIVFSLADE